MAHSVLKEEEETPLKEEETPRIITGDVSPLDGERIGELFPNNPPTPPLVSDRNPIPEATVSDMGERINYDDLQLKADIVDEERRNRAIGAAAFSIPQAPSEFTNIIKKIIKAPLPKRTHGEAAASILLRDKDGRPEFSSDIDIEHGKNILTNDIVKNLGQGGSYKQLTQTSSDIARAASMQISDGSTPDRRRLISDYNFDEMTLDNFVGYANPFGGERKGGLDVEIWDFIKSIGSGDPDWDSFDKQMESNYGQAWQGRMAAFLAKEVGIDISLLMLASTGIGAPLAALLKFGKTARQVKIIGAANRSLIIGVGGGAAQAGQNVYLGRDPNFMQEAILRGGFQAGGELVFAGAKAGVAHFKGQNRETLISEFAKITNKKSLRGRELSKIFNGHQFDTSTIGAIVKAELVNTVENYEKVMRSTTVSILERNAATKEVREGLAALLGKDITDLNKIDVDIILKDALLLRDTFANEKLVAFSNQDKHTRGLSLHMMGSTLGHRENLTKNFEMFFLDKAGKPNFVVDLRKTSRNINSSDIKILEDAMKKLRVAEPSRISKQSGSNYLTTHDFSSKMDKGFKRLYKDAVGHLTKEEKAVVSSILHQGYADGTIYDLVRIAPKGMSRKLLTPRVIEAYNKQRLTMDLAYEVLNATKLTVLKGKVKLIGGKHFEIIPGRAP